MKKRKEITDKIVKQILFFAAILCASFIILIIIFILIKGMAPFFKLYDIGGGFYKVEIGQFIIGSEWYQYPNIYGVGYIIIDTVYVVLQALVIAIPVSILTALFICKIAPRILSKILINVIEILAAIPSVIYGLFGRGVITKFVIWIGKIFNYQTTGGKSALAISIVLAIMIIPTITMLSETAINAVKQDLVNASLALGATPTQTNFKIVLNSAKSGIFSGIILGVGRALGEATAVSMVAGNAGSGPSFNPLDISATLTSTMLQGIHETTGLDYDIRFSVGIVLIILILFSNLILNIIRRKIKNA
ncbi:MAG: phosphate ABC transporter permease subunit PstC [Bacilli bacterium]